jgi:hypothetical protein
MRISSSLILVPVIAVAAENLDKHAEPGEMASTLTSSLVTPAPKAGDWQWYLEGRSNQDVEPREVVQNPGVVLAPTQADPTTTLWIPTKLPDGEVVNVPTVFVQTFAAVPEQWPLPMSGAIGMAGSPSSTPVAARSLKARSEGTFGQTPWIGMAVGLVCTGFAAVMLG